MSGLIIMSFKTGSPDPQYSGKVNTFAMTFNDIPLTGRLIVTYRSNMVGIAGFEPAVSSPPDLRVRPDYAIPR